MGVNESGEIFDGAFGHFNNNYIWVVIDILIVFLLIKIIDKTWDVIINSFTFELMDIEYFPLNQFIKIEIHTFLRNTLQNIRSKSLIESSHSLLPPYPLKNIQGSTVFLNVSTIHILVLLQPCTNSCERVHNQTWEYSWHTSADKIFLGVLSLRNLKIIIDYSWAIVKVHLCCSDYSKS